MNKPIFSSLWYCDGTTHTNCGILLPSEIGNSRILHDLLRCNFFEDLKKRRGKLEQEVAKKTIGISWKASKAFLKTYRLDCGWVLGNDKSFIWTHSMFFLFLSHPECPVVYQSYPRGVDSVAWALQYKVVL